MFDWILNMSLKIPAQSNNKDMDVVVMTRSWTLFYCLLKLNVNKQVCGQLLEKVRTR